MLQAQSESPPPTATLGSKMDPLITDTSVFPLSCYESVTGEDVFSPDMAVSENRNPNVLRDHHDSVADEASFFLDHDSNISGSQLPHSSTPQHAYKIAFPKHYNQHQYYHPYYPPSYIPPYNMATSYPQQQQQVNNQPSYASQSTHQHNLHNLSHNIQHPYNQPLNNQYIQYYPFNDIYFGNTTSAATASGNNHGHEDDYDLSLPVRLHDPMGYDDNGGSNNTALIYHHQKSPFVIEYPVFSPDDQSATNNNLLEPEHQQQQQQQQQDDNQSYKRHVNPSEVITPELFQSLHAPMLAARGRKPSMLQPHPYNIKRRPHQQHPHHILQYHPMNSHSQYQSQSQQQQQQQHHSGYTRQGDLNGLNDGKSGGNNAPVVIGPDGNVYQKPPYSYAALISRALRECGTGKLTLSGIYEWIKEKFPYYRTAEAAWQIPRPANEPGKGGFWMLDEDYIRQQALAKQQTQQLNMSLNTPNASDETCAQASSGATNAIKRVRSRRASVAQLDSSMFSDVETVGVLSSSSNAVPKKRGRKSGKRASSNDELLVSGLPELSTAAAASDFGEHSDFVGFQEYLYTGSGGPTTTTSMENIDNVKQILQ